MDDQLYREIILEHYKNPQNYGVIDDADIDIQDHNPLCGDSIRITAKFRGETSSTRGLTPSEIDIKFTCEGCAISKASASILTELVKSIGVAKFQALSQEAYLENLEIQLTAARLKCALLPYSTFKKALL